MARNTRDDRTAENWSQLRGRARERWGKLTEDDLDSVDGRRDRLSERIQTRYGRSEEDANQETDDFFENEERDLH